MLRDPHYKKLRRRGDFTLGGALVPTRFTIAGSYRRLTTRLAPRPGVDFCFKFTVRSRDELINVQSWLTRTSVQPAKARPENKLLSVGEAAMARVEAISAAGIKGSPTQRLKVRFPAIEALEAALSAELPASIPLINRQRRLLAVEMPSGRGRTSERDGARYLTYLEKEYGAEVTPDIQYDWEDWRQTGLPSFGPDHTWSSDLDDVLRHIRAPEAWKDTRGAGVAIAVIDSGVNGLHPEFPAHKRVAPYGNRDYEDQLGHGTMCACIATAAPVGGRLGGVAPDAQLISCRTRFFSTEITDIYDFLVRQKLALGIPIVASNNWGCRTGTPPVPDPDVAEALDDAAGIVLVFSAGNYHQLVPAPRRCGPNSIWAPKSRANVLTVATCNLDNEMWDYSGRGPGQPSAGPCNDKPDVTAPTPANGRVLHGDRYQVLQTGWGTSGAAPQAAGLAALLLSLDPGLTPPHIFDVIRKSCNNLGFEKTCQGAGLIDCRAAVDMI